MILNGLVGHWQTWLLIAGAWVGIGLVYALLFGLLARVGAWRERR